MEIALKKSLYREIALSVQTVGNKQVGGDGRERSKQIGDGEMDEEESPATCALGTEVGPET